MSRAFVKDDVERPEEPIDLPVSDAPNYVTPEGLVALRARLEAAEAEHDGRLVRYLTHRIDTAIVVEKKKKPSRIEFGAEVEVVDERGNATRFTIVGDDEAQPLEGRISYGSPVAQALLGKTKGASVIVTRPAGPIRYKITAIR